MTLGPSAILSGGLYVIHGCLLVAYVLAMAAYFNLSAFIGLLPLVIVQAVCVKKLYQRQWSFCQPRQWQFYDDHARLKQADNWLRMEVKAHQVWPWCVIIQYRPLPTNPLQKSSSWGWDIFMIDACQQESHRQLVALMRCEYQGKMV